MSYLLPYVTFGRLLEFRLLTASRHSLTSHSAFRGISQASWMPWCTAHWAELFASCEWQPWPPARLHLNKAMEIPEARHLELIETLGLKKTFKIIRSKHQSDLPIPVTKTGPSEPHPHVSSILPGREAPLLLWAPAPMLCTEYCIFMSRNKVNEIDGNIYFSIMFTLNRKIHALIQVPLIQAWKQTAVGGTWLDFAFSSRCPALLFINW